MKKYLLFLSITFVCLFETTVTSQVFGTTVFNQGLCIGSKAYASVTTTASGATGYSWTANSSTCVATHTPASNGLSTIITYPCCGVFTVTCSAYNGTTFISSVTSQATVSCNSASTLTISSTASNGTFCSTSNVTLSANGNTTYTWLPGNTNNPTVLITPTTSGCYTVVANNSLGCFNMSPSYCMSVIPTYTFGITGNTVVCAGNSTTLSLSGGPSFVTNPGNIISSNPVLTPSVPTAYTLSCPSTSYACPSYSTVVIIVNPNPTISIVASGSASLCAGSSKTIQAFGGTTYTWSNGANSNSIVVSPTVNTCYSVVINNSVSPCLNSAQYCLTVSPLPILNVNGNTTVCLGSSTTLTVSGSSISYTWASGNTNGSSLNILPTSTTAVSNNVYGKDANGCANFASYTVTALNTCADVWPGDANRDGLVSTSDVLELGLAASSTGAVRTVTGNAWNSHFASAWTGTVSTGWNKAHADCNGDGLVDNNDTAAISVNFGLTHSFREAGINAVNPDISLVPQQSVAFEGIWNKADVILGDATSIQNQIYGVTFELNYDQGKIQNDSVKLVYTPSFLNASNQNITFRKPIFSNGKLYCATVRADHANVNGNGKIGELWYKVKSGLPNNSSLQISVSSGIRINTAGITGTLSSGSVSNLNVSTNLTGLINLSSLQNSIVIFPNPSKDLLALNNNSGLLTHFRLFDLSGREILRGEFTNSKTIGLSGVASGAYILRFESGMEQVNKKLVIE